MRKQLKDDILSDRERSAATGHVSLAGKRSGVSRGPVMMLVLLATVVMLLSGNFPTHINTVNLWVGSCGAAAPPVFLLLTVLATACGFPRLVSCSLASMLFGAWLGLLLALAGTLAGSYLTFLVAQRQRGYIMRRWRWLFLMTARVQAGGIAGVVLIRQLPINVFYNNLLLGIAGVGSRQFLLGSLIGFLPGAVLSAMLGAGLLQLQPGARLSQALAGAALLLTILFLARKLRDIAGSSAQGTGRAVTASLPFHK